MQVLGLERTWGSKVSTSTWRIGLDSIANDQRIVILTPHILMAVSRTNAGQRGSPTAFMSESPTLTSKVPFEDTVGQRKKLWEFPTYLHCSVVGTCLSTSELRRIISRVKGHDLKGLSDLTLHEEAVSIAGHHDVAGKLLHKALDRRYEATIKRFSKAKDMHEVRRFWDDARHSGDIPGAYWALLTHPASTDEMTKAAFGDLHMLSHLVGAANRADIRRLTVLEAEKAELALKVEK
jgi:hypothetical protein